MMDESNSSRVHSTDRGITLVWKIKYRGLTDVSSAGASQWMPLGVAEGMDGDGEGSEGDERCGFVVT
jgi:hypothetical protein